MGVNNEKIINNINCDHFGKWDLFHNFGRAKKNKNSNTLYLFCRHCNASMHQYYYIGI